MRGSTRGPENALRGIVVFSGGGGGGGGGKGLRVYVGFGV